MLPPGLPSLATLASTFLTLTTLTQANPPSPLFTGRGQIHLLATTDITKASPITDRIGCLNAHGQATPYAFDCAVFTRLDEQPHTLSSPLGACSFRNESMPLNKDSVYGRNTHAWSCGGGKGIAGEGVEYYYSVDGLKYPFIWTGNLDCYFDTFDPASVKESGPQPVWQFFWGSQQFDVAPGHVRVAWLWVPIPESGEDQK